MPNFTNANSIEGYWIDGYLSQAAYNRWNDLLKKSPAELSQLLTVCRLTVYKSEYINQLSNPYIIDFSTQPQHTKNLRGKYGLKDISIKPIGTPPGVMFEITLNITILDPTLIDSDDPILCLTRLNTVAKLDVGWNDCVFKSSTDLDTATNNGGGFSLYGNVTNSDINISHNTLKTETELSVTLTSLNYAIHSNINLKSLLPKNFKLSSLPIEKNTILTKTGRDYISLNSILSTIEKSLNATVQALKLNVIVPKHILNANLDSDAVAVFAEKITTNVTKVSNSNTIGDICIDTKSLENIFINSTTLSDFIRKITTFINKELKYGISLAMKVLPPSGKNVIIYNKTQESNFGEPTTKRYLEIDFSNNNSIIKDMSIRKNLDNAKDIQNYIEMNAGETMPKELLEAFISWHSPYSETLIVPDIKSSGAASNIRINIIDLEPKFNVAIASSTNVAKADQTPRGEPSNVLSDKELSDIEKGIRNLRTRESILKYLPYQLEMTIIGISDIWIGNRIMIKNSPISFLNYDNILNNTLWRITDINHSISHNFWETKITAITERVNNKPRNPNITNKSESTTAQPSSTAAELEYQSTTYFR